MSWLLPPLEPRFEAALRDVRARTVEARTAAARRLGRPEAGRADEANAGLLSLLGDPQASVRAAALRSLAEIGTADAHGPIKACLDDTDPLVRELSAMALADIAHPEREAILLDALAHPAPEVRFQALAACAALCPTRAASPIMGLTRDPDDRVREAATRALASLDGDDGRVATRLRALLDDSAENVRLEAALLLSDRCEPAALAELQAALLRPDARLDALAALSGYRDDLATRDAVFALGQRVWVSPIVNAAAGRTLVAMGDRARGVACLREALGAFRREGRNLALEAVRDHGLWELGPELLTLSRRPRGADPGLLDQACEAVADGSPEAARARAHLRHQGRKPM